jgi:Ca2+-binding EF-hand superfamily protein
MQEELRMRRPVILSSLVALILAAPAIARADDDKVPAHIQKQLETRKQDMKKLDANQDGFITPAELQGGVTMKFNSADLNKDGILSADEMAAVREQYKAPPKDGSRGGKLDRNQAATRMKTHYKNADLNEDGNISQQEYQQYFGQRYQNFDPDGNGIITEQEYRTDGEKLPSAYRRKKTD